METHGFNIPIDKEIRQFFYHLHTHSRTILSAKFGDGKSYFLNKFKEDENVVKDFKILKVYPVNYQVAENADVFNLLKYDILLQLLVEDMISEDAIKKPFLEFEDGASFLSALFDGISEINPSPKTILPRSSLKVLSSIATIRLKQRINKGGKTSARELIKLFEKESIQYGEDSITRLIRQSIRCWREKMGRQVVLVVEDLDRLDPSHLFRILNVFSSHMDYIYKTGEDPTDTLVGSKFGFDSIVFVMDFENLKRTFAHYYGNDVSFKGYISKFIPQGYFKYSLRQSANSYFYGTIQNITGMEQHHISGLLNSKINDISIRDMYYAVKDVDIQVDFAPVRNINSNFLYMLVIMRRVGMASLTITTECENLYKNDPVPFIRYIIDFTLIDGFSDEKGALKVSDTYMYKITGRHDDGFSTLNRIMSAPSSMKRFNVHTFVSKLLDFVLE